jgi:hypothetical protein
MASPSGRSIRSSIRSASISGTRTVSPERTRATVLTAVEWVSPGRTAAKGDLHEWSRIATRLIRKFLPNFCPSEVT